MDSTPAGHLKEAGVFDWVAPVAPPEAPAIAAAQGLGGGLLLLIDRQVHVERAEMFLHVACRVLTDAGLRGMSTLAIEFDPSFQTVFVHTVEVIRGGVR